MHSIYKLLSFLIIFFLIISCGHRKSPTGGKKDTINPEILAISPDEFSDINEQNIEVVFSKPIDRTSILTGIYIYPPILKKKFKWDKNILTIRILEELEQNTNYFFTFSTKIKGEHKNELDRNYIFIFKSGKLNENRISGNILYEDESDIGLPVKVNLMTIDSTEIYSKEIKGQTYELNNLNNITHIIEAYIDKNNNQKYDYEKEPYFHTLIPEKQISNIDIELSYADTVKPEIKSAKVLSNNQIELFFSEEISGFSELQLFTTDLIPEHLNIKAHSLRGEKLSIITDTMDTLKYNFEITDLEDLKHNISESASIFLDGNVIQDTIPPEVIFVYPRNGSTINTLLPQIKITFSEIILKSDFKSQLIASETLEEIPLKILEFDSDIYLIQPLKKLSNYSSYCLKLSVSDVNGNDLKGDFEINFIPIIR
ncbi:MAG: Ig-like domain-containing protein [Candidatus Cloacimonetes bacterium]|nr:Ig-like domain-containing protein [Candidatus Cloacimonadota bacterium]